MKNFFFLLALFCLCFASEQSKIVYLRLMSPSLEQQEIYVGQKIALTYNLFLFSNASLIDVEFIPNDQTKLAEGITLLNPQSDWVKKEDDSYENTFIFKINSPHFALPTLKIMAISQDGQYVDSDEVLGKRFEAIALDSASYSSVLAKELKATNSRAKKYDAWSNIIIFDLESLDGNLEDFHLKGIEKQGFNGKIIEADGVARGLYYAVIPIHLKELKFTFFNLNTMQYEDQVLEIEIQDDRVSTQVDLTPKNNFLIFSNLVIVVFILFILALAFLYRNKKIVFYSLCFCAFVLCVVLFLRLLTFKEIILKNGSVITILPTQNSTVMKTLQSSLNVEVIGERGCFYKIKFEDSKIGWVRKDDCSED